MRWPLSFFNLRQRPDKAPRADTAPDIGGQVQLWCHASTGSQFSAMAELITRCRTEVPELTAILTTSMAEADVAIAGIALGSDVRTAEIDTAAPELIPDIRARIIVWAGSEDSICPLIKQAIRGADLILVDVSASSAGRFGWLSGAANQKANLLNCARVYARNSHVVDWLASQGTLPSKIGDFGPLAPGVAIPQCDDKQLSEYATLTSARPIWLCTSVTELEQDLILNAHRKAVRSAHRLLLVVSPTDPAQGPEIADWFDAQGLKAGCRSRGGDPDPETQVFIADGPDEVFIWYRLATITYIGGSLAGVAIDNPYWPAALGSVVVYGPNTGRHNNLFQRLSEGRAAISVSDSDELGQMIKHLQSPHHAAELANNAWEVTSAGADVIDALVADVLDRLDPSAGGT